MATIPLGPGRRVRGAGAPMVRVADLTAPGRALEQAADTGLQIRDRQLAQEAAQAEAERRRQEATAEAAQRARDAAHLQGVEDQLTDLHDEIGAGVLQGQIPKADAEKVFSERSRKVVDDGMGGFSEFGRQAVAPRLQGSAARLGNSLRRTVERKDREDVTADMTSRLERLQRDYATEPQRAEHEAMAVFEALGPFSTLPASKLAEARQKWKEGAQYTAGYEAVSRGRDDPKALADAEQFLGTLTDIDPQRRAVLMDRAAGYRLHQQQQAELRAARAERAAERTMRKAQAEFETFQALADKGGVLEPEYIDRVTAATAGTPYQAGVRALAQQARETGGLAAQPIAAQRRLLDDLDAQIAAGGRSPALDKRREQVQKVLNAAETDLQRDPLRAGLERGVIAELRPLNLTGGVDGVAAQLAERVAAADTVRQWSGRAASPLTSDEARTFGAMLSALPPEQRANAVAAVAGVVPPQQAAALARQIDAQDKPLALAMAAGASRTTTGRTTAELILRGAQAVKDKAIKEDAGAQFGVKAEIAKVVGDAVPAAARDDVIQAARLIYLGKQAAGEEVSFPGAVRLAIGGDIVARPNGQRVPVPPGVDLEQRLLQFPVAKIAAQAPDGFVRLPGGRPMGVPEFLVALPASQLEPAGLGRYLVRSGGSLVLNERREPIVVDVR